jgi:hypothetical protein
MIIKFNRKERHGKKTRSKNSVSAGSSGIEEEKMSEKKKGKQTDIQPISMPGSSNAPEAKIGEAKVVEIVDKFRHGVLNVDADTFIPRSTPEPNRDFLEPEKVVEIIDQLIKC